MECEDISGYVYARVWRRVGWLVYRVCIENERERANTDRPGIDPPATRWQVFSQVKNTHGLAAECMNKFTKGQNISNYYCHKQQLKNCRLNKIKFWFQHQKNK